MSDEREGVSIPAGLTLTSPTLVGKLVGPAGWQIVPTQPNYRLRQALEIALDITIKSEQWELAWPAMLAAAPSLSPCPSDSGKVEAVSVPYELLHALWCYGNLRPVVSVVYRHGTHEKCLDEANRLLALASHPIPPAPMFECPDCGADLAIESHNLACPKMQPTPLVGSWPGEEAIADLIMQSEAEHKFDLSPAERRATTRLEYVARAVLKLFENTRSLIHERTFPLNGQCDHPVSEDGK